MSDSGGEFTPEEIAKGEQVTRYYQELDPDDPKNQPTDDETKTILPLHTMIKEAQDDQS